ncbi:hypothetical protein SISSUDRAFT_1133129 [Sistotremastrum suecicum HHB10207 ss-3]|uniref:F-box domain-containing protein n=1 Tax=Sistotremastrum suecicum HHB10207 ss-3 TaxID=1314776 RepID=A0A165XSE9_9AGAM|nr:hypothetical protein SISSUDRAFT_1133129 [Sistotremastrum suecicum HHB10207 ss-3]
MVEVAPEFLVQRASECRSSLSPPTQGTRPISEIDVGYTIHLPYDVWDPIVRYLVTRKPDDPLAALLVCKDWHAVAVEKFYTYVKIKSFAKTLSFAVNTPSKYKRTVRYLSLSYSDDEKPPTEDIANKVWKRLYQCKNLIGLSAKYTVQFGGALSVWINYSTPKYVQLDLSYRKSWLYQPGAKYPIAQGVKRLRLCWPLTEPPHECYQENFPLSNIFGLQWSPAILLHCADHIG